jgi:hypothetical protein
MVRSGLKILMEAGDLVISSNLKDADRLIRELEGMRLAAAGTGKTLADGAGHDDLALALSLACWRAKRPRNGFGTSASPEYSRGNSQLLHSVCRALENLCPRAGNAASPSA